MHLVAGGGDDEQRDDSDVTEERRATWRLKAQNRLLSFFN